MKKKRGFTPLEKQTAALAVNQKASSGEIRGAGKKSKFRQNSLTGFTLTEIVVVIFIIILLTSIGTYVYVNYKSRMIVSNDTIALYNDLKEAINEVNVGKKFCRIAFNQGGGYSIFYASTISPPAGVPAGLTMPMGAGPAQPMPIPTATAPAAPPAPGQYMTQKAVVFTSKIRAELSGEANAIEISPYARNISSGGVGRWTNNYICFKTGSTEAPPVSADIVGDIMITDGKNQGILRVYLSGRLEIIK